MRKWKLIASLSLVFVYIDAWLNQGNKNRGKEAHFLF
jgi:hypothetical protein